MTKKQFNAVVKLLKADCHLQREYIDDKGRTCAIGCLALAAKVPKRILKNNNDVFIAMLDQVVEPIQRKFGLDEDIQKTIQCRNDSDNIEHSTLAARRKYVIEAVRDYFKEQAE